MTSATIDGAHLEAWESRRFRAAAIAIFFALLVKFIAYAWLVTPLWDIPDESGHFSYVEDISYGKMPLLGKAMIADDVNTSWHGPGTKPGANWIAQHPPLFYLLDAPILLTARAAGLNFEQQVRASRMLSSLFGALTVLGLIYLVTDATGSPQLGFASGIFLAATPMLTHLSSGVTHDTLIACGSTWALRYCVKWLRSDSNTYLWIGGLLVAACTVSKITALAMAVPFFFMLTGMLWMRLRTKNPAVWLVQSACLWFIMFLPVCIWIVHNLVLFGKPFPDASDPSLYVHIGFLEYMKAFPVWEHTLLNGIALIGWTGSNHGELHWIQANGSLARYFMGCILFCSLSTVVISVGNMLGVQQQRKLNLWLPCLLGLTVIGICTQYSEMTLARGTCIAIAAGLVSILISACRCREWETHTRWILFACALCSLFFAFEYYNFLRQSFSGELRATHGRYLYPVMPMMLIALTWQLRQRWTSNALVVTAVCALVVSEHFFLHQVFELYKKL